ncbi:fibronectin type III domain-containing protein [Flagellimonas lutimaris]|nr:fibronectin type III domain-containing protein [Allomuricauda lutimaris]
MKKFHFTLLIAFLLMACSKDNNANEITEKGEEEIVNLAPNNFDLEILNISDAGAIINWTEAEDPEGDTVTYSIYLNQSLIVENITERTYQFIELEELTNYSGKIIAKDVYNNETESNFSFQTEKYYLKYLKTYEFGDTNYGTGYASGTPYSMLKTFDKNYIIAGKSVRPNGDGLHFFVLKIDYDGNQIWKRFYDYELGDDWNFKIIQTNDNGFVLVGGPFVVKLSIDGDVLWDKRIDTYLDLSYSFLSTIGQLKSVVEDINGNIYIVGGRVSENPNIKEQGVLTKLNSFGSILWEKTYEPSRRNYFNDIILDNTGNLLVLGSTETNNATSTQDEQIDFWILNVNHEGDIIWKNTYGDGGYDFPSQIILKQNGNYVFAGYSWGAYDISSGRIFEIDTEGNEIWKNTNELSSTFSITETQDNGLITTGHVDFGNYGALGIFKFDSSGNKEWNQGFQEPFTYLRGWSIISEEDGGYRIAGNLNKIYYYGEEKPLLLIYKTDPFGNYK